MRCPTLKELPPPEGKTGWPWTKESRQLPDKTPDGRPWPRISIVTPNYNYGQFIEETIRSVLLQGYPNIEYIIIDDGSTDNSIDIIKKYEKWLAYWETGPNRGEAHAINKGLGQASGVIAACLNSDDFYLAGALRHIGWVYAKLNFDVFIGRVKLDMSRPRYFLMRRSWWKDKLKPFKPFTYPFIFSDKSRAYELSGESFFWNHSKYGKMRFREQFHSCHVVWWYIHIFSGALAVHSSRRIGTFRAHPGQKSVRLKELRRIEHQQITSEVTPYKSRITEDVKRELVSSYYRASVRAFLLRLLMPWANFLFQYQHPPYIDHF